MACDTCKHKDKCNKISYIGNIINPKLVFILPHAKEEDINFKRTETPFGGKSHDYLILRETLKELELIQRDVCVIFVIQSAITFPSTMPNSKKKSYLYSLAKECKDNLFNMLSQLPEDVLIVTIGEIPNKILLNVKNITNISGTLRYRVVKYKGEIIDKNGNKKTKQLEKKFKVIPLLNPLSININPMRNKKIYVKSVSFIKRLLNGKKEDDVKYHIVKPNEVERFTNVLLNPSKPINHIYFDIESSSLIHHKSKVIGVSIATDTHPVSFYIPIYDFNWEEKGEIITINEKQREVIKSCIRKILQKYPVVGHNIKFDIVQLLMNDIISIKDFKIENDTRLMAHIKYNNSLNGLGLKHLCRLFFDVFDDWDESIDKARREYAKKYKLKLEDVSYAVVPTQILGKYGAYDAHYTKLLYNKLIKELTEEELEHNKRLIEQEKAVILWEYYGVRIDTDKYEKLKEITINKVENTKRLLQELPTIAKKYKNKFNPNSTQQIAEISKMYKLPVLKKTKAGNISLDKETIPLYLDRDAISEEAKKFCEYLLEYKFYNKALTSYINPIPREMDENNIFRTSFNVCGTVSGRISSYFHTLPSRGEFNKNFKRLIRSRWDDGIIVALDVSQAEPRVMASLSGDENLIYIYQTGKDIYKYIATKVYNYSYDEVPKNVRNSMKSLVLALMYGMSPATFAQKTKITVEEAEKIFEQFFKEFKDVKKFIEERHKEVFRSNGVKTPFGRFIPINTYDKEDAKRKAQNYIIQSTASEMCLDCFKDVTFHLISKGMKSKVIGSVHDSIIIDTRPEEMFEVLKILKYYVEQKPRFKYKWLKVPIKTDMSIGCSWGNSVKIKKWKGSQLIVEGYADDLNDLLRILQDYDLIECEVLDEREIELPDDTLIKSNLWGEYKLVF